MDGLLVLSEPAASDTYLTRFALPSRDHLLPHRVEGHGHLKAARGFDGASSRDRRGTPTESHGGGLCVCSRPDFSKIES